MEKEFVVGKISDIVNGEKTLREYHIKDSRKLGLPPFVINGKYVNLSDINEANLGQYTFRRVIAGMGFERTEMAIFEDGKAPEWRVCNIEKIEEF